MIGYKVLAYLVAILIFQLVGVSGTVPACFASGRKKIEAHSKDFKRFPEGSPEAALTAFVEADVGALNNREDDERFPLWWNLTEGGGVPDDGYIHLYIKSYRIGDVVTRYGGNEAIISLSLDVRMVWASGNPKSSEKSWRNLPVHVNGKKYSLTSDAFVVDIFGYEAAKNIINKVPDEYFVLKNMQKWTFNVRMIKIKNKWVISADTIPVPLTYLSLEINSYMSEVEHERLMHETCTGKRKVRKSLLRRYTIDVQSKVGEDINKFRQEFCADDYMKFRESYLILMPEKIDKLKVVDRD